MLRIQLVIEDIDIVADRDTITPDRWVGAVSDGLTGTTHPFTIGDVELAAIVALAIGGSALEEQTLTAEGLRNIAEGAIVDWPAECRPIE